MDCIFCKIVNGEIPSKKLYEDDNVIVIMDVNPKVDGHSLIIPKKHITDFTEISDEEYANVNKVAKLVGLSIMKKLGASAITTAVNYGESQAVKHFHMHLLPDYTIKEKSDRTIEIHRRTDYLRHRTDSNQSLV